MLITQNNLQQVILALRQCAEEHKKERVPTFAICTTDLCTDVATFLESLLEREIKKKEV